ncbi:hypothetical protein [Streptomyces albospinus]|uniref:hypothetical protein n=1 Tax=Streptomyces albospinus TaxID=285515 RepID=UPI0016707201|nr:hypothetical protein [Streptomyces albospinus]
MPNPLTVSPPKSGPGNEDELAYGSIDLVISNSGSTPVRCSRIAIVLPVGSLAQDLALTGEGIAPYVEPESGWTIVGPQPDVLLAVPTAETAVFPAAGEATGDSSKVRFSVEPTGGTSEVTVDGLYITLKNIAISNRTGVARIGIEEWATTGSTIPEVPNTGTLDVAKFPFRSGADPAPGVGRALVAVTAQGGPPATRIAAGDPVRLEWHHVRGDNHELYMDGERVPDPSIPGGSVYPVPAGKVLRDTAFALKTVTPTPDGGFVTRWDHLTVCVTDQTLAAVTVSGPIQANGTLTTSSAGETTFHHAVSVVDGKELVASGDLCVDGSVKSTSGTTKVGGALNVSGQVQAVAGIRIDGDVTSSKSGISVGTNVDLTSGHKLDVYDTFVADSNTKTAWMRNMSVAGTADLVKQGTMFYETTGTGTWSYRANTAGLVIATVNVDSGVAGHATADTWGSGGQGWANLRAAGNQAGTIAVAKGASFWVRHTRWGGSSNAKFYWVPLGVGDQPTPTQALSSAAEEPVGE